MERTMYHLNFRLKGKAKIETVMFTTDRRHMIKSAGADLLAEKLRKDHREMTRGTFYAVGVGPGDPEPLTVKAINTIKKLSGYRCTKKRGFGKYRFENRRKLYHRQRTVRVRNAYDQG